MKAALSALLSTGTDGDGRAGHAAALLHRQHVGDGDDAVHQMTDADILVLGMLVVVVVPQAERDGRRAELLADQIERQAAAEAGQDDQRAVARAARATATAASG